ncbi:hypothetical protein BN863_29400 [Formosa agariphila KMM 3901]|uniref:Secretion system C-terminal sorting domain-containing protein n=1 Tax=Formosa agariphila (strain DSM 15362 / KCTC 12365 / LMG 23005 / KMM 3901 / M-2Alg 35-1) TaxID=1347342 RepID=T2KP71_FORAG|nr:T9SS type A sorting domain-containing protein [Formosa agariphila]CDF80652.1 hypothetical protein BN863_29400 [Formosa agariphila KMM 3901]
MKKIYYLLLVFLLTITHSSFGQEITVATQSFEGVGNWDLNEIPDTGTTQNNVIWGKVSSLSTLVPSAGNQFWGLKNPLTNPNNSVYTLAYESLAIDEYEDVKISFDYMYESTSSIFPSTYATLNIDDTVYYIVLQFSGNTGSNSITIDLNDYPAHPNPTNVSLSIVVNYNIGPPPFGNASNLYTNVNLGFDNFKVKGSITGFTGFIYDNGWMNGTPEDSNASQAKDAIIVAGNYEFTGITRVKSLTISGTGSATVAENATLYIANDLLVDDNLIVNSTSNSYGSLYVNGSSTGSMTYNLWVKEYDTNDLVTAPVYGEDFGTFASRNETKLATSGSNSRVKEFGPFIKNPGVYLKWDSLNEKDEILETAEGYRAATKTTSDNILSFKGLNHTTNYNKSVEHAPAGAASQWNLIGNPYTTYLNIPEFVNYNKSKMENGKGGVYAYNGTNWTVYNESSTTHMAPGQGFYIATQLTSTTMNFIRGMREVQGGDDFIAGRTTAPSLLTLNLSTSAEEKHSTEIYFNDETTLGLDQGFDSSIFGNNASGFTMFTQLVESNPSYKLAIQTMPNTALDNEGTAIPLGIIAPKGQQITIDIKENTLNSTATIILEDTKTNTWTTLTDKAYVFTAEESLNGLGRFILHVSDANRLSIVEKNTLESLQFFTGNKSIKIKGNLEKNTKIIVYDIQGRQINNSVLSNSVNEYTINANNYSSGIYIVKVENQVGNRTTKRVILK